MKLYFYYHIAFLCFLIVLPGIVFAQDIERREGTITYLTKQNIYVEFAKTEGVNTGDTLFIFRQSMRVPAVLIKFISSRSCAGGVIGDIKLQIGDTLQAYIRMQGAVPDSNQSGVETTAPGTSQNTGVETKTLPKKVDITSETVFRGRASVQSSSSFVNGGTEDDLQRWRYTFSLDGGNVFTPGLSFRSYLNYAYNTRDWPVIKSAPLNRINLYDLYFSYAINETDRLSFGRKINSRISNIGAIDGLQFESSAYGLEYGAFAGSRPSPMNYSVDLKLFQAGAYLSKTDSLGAGSMENSIAVANQTNNFSSDRRFIYFQHSSYLFSGMNIFASSEADFFKNIAGSISNKPELSSVYLSLRNRISSVLSIHISYDARRNVVYYESYKNFIDSLFTNELRQGAKAAVTYRIYTGLMINISGGYRFRKGDIKSSSNVIGYINYSSVPYITGSASYSYAHIASSYTNADNHTITYRNDINRDISFAAGYRFLQYIYTGRNHKSTQNILFGDVNWNFSGRSYLSVNVEEAFAGKVTSGRVYIDITTRF